MLLNASKFYEIEDNVKKSFVISLEYDGIQSDFTFDVKWISFTEYWVSGAQIVFVLCFASVICLLPLVGMATYHIYKFSGIRKANMEDYTFFTDNYLPFVRYSYSGSGKNNREDLNEGDCAWTVVLHEYFSSFLWLFPGIPITDTNTCTKLISFILKILSIAMAIFAAVFGCINNAPLDLTWIPLALIILTPLVPALMEGYLSKSARKEISNIQAHLLAPINPSEGYDKPDKEDFFRLCYRYFFRRGNTMAIYITGATVFYYSFGAFASWDNYAHISSLNVALLILIYSYFWGFFMSRLLFAPISNLHDEFAPVVRGIEAMSQKEVYEAALFLWDPDAPEETRAVHTVSAWKNNIEATKDWWNARKELCKFSDKLSVKMASTQFAFPSFLTAVVILWQVYKGFAGTWQVDGWVMSCVIAAATVLGCGTKILWRASKGNSLLEQHEEWIQIGIMQCRTVQEINFQENLASPRASELVPLLDNAIELEPLVLSEDKENDDPEQKEFAKKENEVEDPPKDTEENSEKENMLDHMYANEVDQEMIVSNEEMMKLENMKSQEIHQRHLLLCQMRDEIYDSIFRDQVPRLSVFGVPLTKAKIEGVLVSIIIAVVSSIISSAGG